MEVKIKKLHPNAVIPKYAKLGDAGLDLTATSYEYKNGRHVYGIGLAFEIPEGHVGLIFPRSSIIKYDLRLCNCVPVLDSAFRGELMLFFENNAMEPRGISYCRKLIWDVDKNESIEKPSKILETYKVGERIAQLIIMPYPQIELIESEELSYTERGSGGMGSTGK